MILEENETCFSCWDWVWVRKEHCESQAGRGSLRDHSLRGVGPSPAAGWQTGKNVGIHTHISAASVRRQKPLSFWIFERRNWLPFGQLPARWPHSHGEEHISHLSAVLVAQAGTSKTFWKRHDLSFRPVSYIFCCPPIPYLYKYYYALAKFKVVDSFQCLLLKMCNKNLYSVRKSGKCLHLALSLLKSTKLWQ